MATALITGATAGIGAAFARLLAERGHDLVLVARDAERLEQTAQALRARHSVQVDVLPADLVDTESRSTVEDRLLEQDRPVDILINNAGLGTGRSFVDGTIEDEERLLQLNVVAVLRLAKAAAPGMGGRQRGVIINVSSVAGFLPRGTYSASKAWVTSFSSGLAVELGPHGVRVVALCPGFVRTEFHERASIDVAGLPSWAWLDADAVAADGWRAVQQGKVVMISDLRYRAVTAVVRHVPPDALAAGIQFARRRGLKI